MHSEHIKLIRDVRNLATIRFSILKSDPHKRAYFLHICEKLSGREEKFYISSNELQEYMDYLHLVEKERDALRVLAREKQKQKEKDLEDKIDIDKVVKLDIEDIIDIEEELDEVDKV